MISWRILKCSNYVDYKCSDNNKLFLHRNWTLSVWRKVQVLTSVAFLETFLRVTTLEKTMGMMCFSHSFLELSRTDYKE